MRFETLTRLAFTSFSFPDVVSTEQKVEQILKEPTIKPAKDERLLALSPVIRPTDGAAAMLYEYAYNPANETHPHHAIAEKLFTNGGIIPVDEVGSISDIRGVYETNGKTITSPTIIDIFVKERAADQLSKQNSENRGEGYVGKALQVKHLS